MTRKLKSTPSYSLSLVLPSRSALLMTEGSCVFFREFSNEASGYVKTHFDFISQTHDTAPPDGMLIDMVASMGILTLSHKHCDPTLRQRADTIYARALHRSSRALDNNQMAKSDEMLSTVWLLTIHEVCRAGFPRTCYHDSDCR